MQGISTPWRGELRPPRNTPAIKKWQASFEPRCASAGETACFVPPGCARGETRASNVAMSFAKECHGKTHRYIRSTKTQNALPESKREFPPYPSVASDGGDENAPSHLGYTPKPYLENGATQRQAPFWGAPTQNSISSAPSIARSGVNPRLLWRWYLAPSCFGANQEITDSRGKRRGDFSTSLDFLRAP